MRDISKYINKDINITTNQNCNNIVIINIHRFEPWSGLCQYTIQNESCTQK